MNKGDKVWVVQLDDARLYDVFPVVFQESRDCHDGTNYYLKIVKTDREGTRHTMVIDRPADRVFTSEKKALEFAATKNFEAADRHQYMRFRQLDRIAKLAAKK